MNQRAEKKARYSEEFPESSPDAVVLFGTRGELVSMNPGFAELFGLAAADARKLDVDSYRALLVEASANPGTGEQIDRAADDAPTRVDFVLELREPKRRFVAVSVAPALDADGNAVGRFAIHHDVTLAYQKLARAEERADLPDINPIALFKCDTLGRVLFMNVAAERFLVGLGLARDKAKRMFPKDFMKRVREAVDDHSGAICFTHTYKRRVLTFTLSPHPRQPHAMVLVEDVTGEREAEEALRRYASELEAKNRELHETQAALVQSEKMASLGSLVAGVAHEINTPIGAINANADVMRRALEKLRGELETASRDTDDHGGIERALQVLEEIKTVNTTACERIVKIVRSLRSFARLDEAERKKADLHEGLESTLTLVHHEIKNRIEIERDFGTLPELECFPGQLNQVFMNILVNAAHAIEGEGKVTIRTRTEGDDIKISFEDTGAGIAPEVRSRIFDPGFTTKGSGVGTGLGLAICYNIVKAHGGSIDVDSEVGEGTTFTVSLPIDPGR